MRIVVFLAEVLRPAVLLLAFLFKLTYKLLFSWWLNPWFDRWVRSKFADEVRMAMPWLFYSFGGRVTPDPNPRSNDANMGYLCVATKSLILKFRRWRSENYAIEVAPSFEPTEFYDILDALRVVDPDADTTDRQLDFSWRAYAKLLEPRFRLLELAFEEERFPETQTRLARSFKNQA